MTARSAAFRRVRLQSVCTEYAPDVLVYGVVSAPLDEAIELFADRREADRVVENWDHDEPDRRALKCSRLDGAQPARVVHRPGLLDSCPLA